jgi:hypothetical protein
MDNALVRRSLHCPQSSENAKRWSPNSDRLPIPTVRDSFRYPCGGRDPTAAQRRCPLRGKQLSFPFREIRPPLPDARIVIF